MFVLDDCLVACQRTDGEQPSGEGGESSNGAVGTLAEG